MKKFFLSIVVVLFGFSVANAYRYRNINLASKAIPIAKYFKNTTAKKSIITINKTIIYDFFKKYPDLKQYLSDVNALYKKRKYNPIWYNKGRLIEFADLLYSKVNLLEDEGLKSDLAYASQIEGVFNSNVTNKLSQTDTEIMLSSMYVYYAKKVFQGIDTKKIREIEWFLPTKNLSYEDLLDSLLANPELLNKNEKQLFGQYYKLRDILKKYRQIEETGEWKPIEIDSSVKEYKLNDSSKTIGQLRHRLALMGDLKSDSKSNRYDEELKTGLLNFKKRNGFKINDEIANWLIKQMNVPIENYIKTIMVNMERCRWIDPQLTKANELIIINIPAYKLIYKKNGEKVLESNVLVGKSMTETAIFSSNMTSIVFSPYWNVPRSIIENELSLALDKDRNAYLDSHNMEWNDGNIRQKPGPQNPLGLIKFVFPNSNDIYLHDTPSKTLFGLNHRAFSHGCINMEKAKELAVLILKNDPDWPIERINEAMKGKRETTCILKNKIPIYIGYFTTWVNEAGEINFYNDVYQKDDQLAELLFLDEPK